jgi:hypothetical protein
LYTIAHSGRVKASLYNVKIGLLERIIHPSCNIKKMSKYIDTEEFRRVANNCQTLGTGCVYGFCQMPTTWALTDDADADADELRFVGINKKVTNVGKDLPATMKSDGAYGAIVLAGIFKDEACTQKATIDDMVRNYDEKKPRAFIITAEDVNDHRCHHNTFRELVGEPMTVVKDDKDVRTRVPFHVLVVRKNSCDVIVLGKKREDDVQEPFDMKTYGKT